MARRLIYFRVRNTYLFCHFEFAFVGFCPFSPVCWLFVLPMLVVLLFVFVLLRLETGVVQQAGARLAT